ncbi:hypothetical protein [Streptomyces sp. Ag109_O5-10]|uniref:hypothetical protein n=1 Tax=Streptomyces sp. Ag109_O5-10 TaxID=1855349 RepID=UPI00089BB2D2|nr:hypothetical protein [Streptomyces sp. Ag109_O5-10]SEF16999.1 hypothetical protein SAMN05216533_8098 [Streptomyces sp. Ag109_O5-10]
MPRPTDWNAIGLDSDPTPGDPDQIRTLSTELNHLGSEARRISTAIDAVMNTAGDSVFVGEAADALRGKVNDRLRGHIEDVAQSFESAATALTTWADKLVDLQSRADGALNSGRGLSEDDPDRETYASTARQAGTEHGEGASTAASSISGVSNIQLPISECQIFWEAFQWLAIILIIPALIFGGPIALLALGVNLTLFIKTIVDFANGNASFLDLFLAGLGILAPTTKALPIFQIIKGVATTAFAKGFANIARGTFQALRNLFTNGFRPTTLLLGLKDLVRLGSTWVYKGGLWVLDGIHNLPNVIGRGVNSLGLTVVQGFKAIPGFVRGLPETLSRGWQATKEWVGQEFGGTKWLRIFLPVDAAEIGEYGFARALRIGLFDRGVLGQHVFGAPITSSIGRTISSVPVDPRTVDALVDMPRIQLNEVRFGAGSGQSSIHNLDLNIPSTHLDVTSTLRPPSLNLGDVGAIAHRGNFGVHAARTVDALVDMPHVQLGTVRVENFGALGGHSGLGVSAGATPTVTTASGLHVPASAGVPGATHGITETPVTAVSGGAHTTLTGLPPTPANLTSHADVLLPGGAHNATHAPGGTVLTGTHATPPPVAATLGDLSTGNPAAGTLHSAFTGTPGVGAVHAPGTPGIGAARTTLTGTPGTNIAHTGLDSAPAPGSPHDVTAPHSLLTGPTTVAHPSPSGLGHGGPGSVDAGVSAFDLLAGTRHHTPHSPVAPGAGDALAERTTSALNAHQTRLHLDELVHQPGSPHPGTPAERLPHGSPSPAPGTPDRLTIGTGGTHEPAPAPVGGAGHPGPGGDPSRSALDLVDTGRSARTTDSPAFAGAPAHTDADKGLAGSASGTSGHAPEHLPEQGAASSSSITAPSDRYKLQFDESALGHTAHDSGGIKVVTDRMSTPYLGGAGVDFVNTAEKQGFTIDLPSGSAGHGGDAFDAAPAAAHSDGFDELLKDANVVKVPGDHQLALRAPRTGQPELHGAAVESGLYTVEKQGTGFVVRQLDAVGGSVVHSWTFKRLGGLRLAEETVRFGDGPFGGVSVKIAGKSVDSVTDGAGTWPAKLAGEDEIVVASASGSHVYSRSTGGLLRSATPDVTLPPRPAGLTGTSADSWDAAAHAARGHMGRAAADNETKLFMQGVIGGAFTSKKGYGGFVNPSALEANPGLVSKVKQFNKVADDLMFEGPNQRMTVWRGVSMDPRAAQADVFVERLPASTSNNRAFQAEWAKNGVNSNRVVFEIDVPADHGKLAMAYPPGYEKAADDALALNQDQWEITLSPTRLHRTGPARIEDGITVVPVRAEQIPQAQLDGLINEKWSGLHSGEAFEDFGRAFGQDAIRRWEGLGDAVVREGGDGPNVRTFTVARPGHADEMTITVTHKVDENAVSVTITGGDRTFAKEWSGTGFNDLAADLRGHVLHNNELLSSLPTPASWGRELPSPVHPATAHPDTPVPSPTRGTPDTTPRPGQDSAHSGGQDLPGRGPRLTPAEIEQAWFRDGERVDALFGHLDDPSRGARREAWRDYVQARYDLGRADDLLPHNGHAGSSRGPTPDEIRARENVDLAQQRYDAAHHRLTDLGVDPVRMEADLAHLRMLSLKERPRVLGGTVSAADDGTAAPAAPAPAAHATTDAALSAPPPRRLGEILADQTKARQELHQAEMKQTQTGKDADKIAEAKDEVRRATTTFEGTSRELDEAFRHELDNHLLSQRELNLLVDQFAGAGDIDRARALQRHALDLDVRTRATTDGSARPDQFIRTGQEIRDQSRHVQQLANDLEGQVRAGSAAPEELRELAGKLDRAATELDASLQGHVTDAARFGGTYTLRNQHGPVAAVAHHLAHLVDEAAQAAGPGDSLVLKGFLGTDASVADVRRGLPALVRRYRENQAFGEVHTGSQWKAVLPGTEAQWQRVFEDFQGFDRLSRSEQHDFVRKLSERNIQDLRAEVDDLLKDMPSAERVRFEQLRDKLMDLPYRIKHATPAYHAIANSGVMSSQGDLARRGVRFLASGKSSAKNTSNLGNDDFVFFRLEVGDKPMATRYGPTTLVFDAKVLEERGGWVSLHDQLHPLDRDTMSRLTVGDDVVRSAKYDEGFNDVGTRGRWTYTYRNGESARQVSFEQEVFHGEHVREALSLSVVREVHLIGGTFKDDVFRLLAESENPEELGSVISKLYRPEAKFGSGLPINPHGSQVRTEWPQPREVHDADGDGRYLPDGNVDPVARAAGKAFDEASDRVRQADNALRSGNARAVRHNLNRARPHAQQSVDLSREFHAVADGPRKDMAEKLLGERIKLLADIDTRIAQLKTEPKAAKAPVVKTPDAGTSTAAPGTGPADLSALPQQAEQALQSIPGITEDMKRMARALGHSDGFRVLKNSSRGTHTKAAVGLDKTEFKVAFDEMRKAGLVKGEPDGLHLTEQGRKLLLPAELDTGLPVPSTSTVTEGLGGPVHAGPELPHTLSGPDTEAGALTGDGHPPHGSPAPRDPDTSPPAPHHTDTNTVPPAPHDLDTTSPAPHHTDTNTVYSSPHDIETKSPSPHDLDTKTPAPHDIETKTPAPHDLDTKTPAPHDLDTKTPSSHAPAPHDAGTQSPAPHHTDSETLPPLLKGGDTAVPPATGHGAATHPLDAETAPQHLSDTTAPHRPTETAPEAFQPHPSDSHTLPSGLTKADPTAPHLTRSETRTPHLPDTDTTPPHPTDSDTAATPLDDTRIDGGRPARPLGDAVLGDVLGTPRRTGDTTVAAPAPGTVHPAAPDLLDRAAFRRSTYRENGIRARSLIRYVDRALDAFHRVPADQLAQRAHALDNLADAAERFLRDRPVSARRPGVEQLLRQVRAEADAYRLLDDFRRLGGDGDGLAGRIRAALADGGTTPHTRATLQTTLDGMDRSAQAQRQNDALSLLAGTPPLRNTGDTTFAAPPPPHGDTTPAAPARHDGDTTPAAPVRPDRGKGPAVPSRQPGETPWAEDSARFDELLGGDGRPFREAWVELSSARVELNRVEDLRGAPGGASTSRGVSEYDVQLNHELITAQDRFRTAYTNLEDLGVHPTEIEARIREIELGATRRGATIGAGKFDTLPDTAPPAVNHIALNDSGTSGPNGLAIQRSVGQDGSVTLQVLDQHLHPDPTRTVVARPDGGFDVRHTQSDIVDTYTVNGDRIAYDTPLLGAGGGPTGLRLHTGINGHGTPQVLTVHGPGADRLTAFPLPDGAARITHLDTGVTRRVDSLGAQLDEGVQLTGRDGVPAGTDRVRVTGAADVHVTDLAGNRLDLRVQDLGDGNGVRVTDGTTGVSVRHDGQGRLQETGVSLTDPRGIRGERFLADEGAGRFTLTDPSGARLPQAVTELPGGSGFRVTDEASGATSRFAGDGRYQDVGLALFDPAANARGARIVVPDGAGGHLLTDAAGQPLIQRVVAVEGDRPRTIDDVTGESVLYDAEGRPVSTSTALADPAGGPRGARFAEPDEAGGFRLTDAGRNPLPDTVTALPGNGGFRTVHATGHRTFAPNGDFAGDGLRLTGRGGVPAGHLDRPLGADQRWLDEAFAPDPARAVGFDAAGRVEIAGPGGRQVFDQHTGRFVRETVPLPGGGHRTTLADGTFTRYDARGAVTATGTPLPAGHGGRHLVVTPPTAEHAGAWLEDAAGARLAHWDAVGRPDGTTRITFGDRTSPRDGEFVHLAADGSVARQGFNVLDNGRRTDYRYVVDHVAGTWERTTRSGEAVAAGSFHHGTADLSGAAGGHVKLLSSTGKQVPVFERRVLPGASGDVVDSFRRTDTIAFARTNPRTHWVRWDDTGTPAGTGSRHHDTAGTGWRDTDGRGRTVREYRDGLQKFDGRTGHTLGTVDGNGAWTWHRYDGDGKVIASGPRTRERIGGGWTDRTADGRIAQQQWGMAEWPERAGQYQEHAMNPADGTLRATWERHSPHGKEVGKRESLAGGFLTTDRWREQRPPTWIRTRWLAGAEHTRPPYAHVRGDDTYQLFTWTKEAGDGTTTSGVRYVAMDGSALDLASDGSFARFSGKLHDGTSLKVGDHAARPDHAPAHPGDLPWQAGDLRGYRQQLTNDPQGRLWQDVHRDAGGVTRTVREGRPNGVVREFTGDRTWVDRDPHGNLVGQSHAHPDGTAGRVVQGSGRADSGRWTWRELDAQGTELGSGRREFFRGSNDSRLPWDDSYRDYDGNGNLVRERRMLDSGRYVDAWRDDRGNWRVSAHERNGTPIGVGNGEQIRRWWNGRAWQDQWAHGARHFRDELHVPGQAAPTVLRETPVHNGGPLRVRAYSTTVTQNTPAGSVWKEFDHGSVVRERKADGGGFLETDAWRGQWNRYNRNGDLIAQRTDSGLVFERDSFGRMRLTGNEYDFRGPLTEIRGWGRTTREAQRMPWSGTVVPGGDAALREARHEPYWQSVAKKAALELGQEFILEFGANLAVNGIVAAVQNKPFTGKDALKSFANAAVGATLKTGLSTAVHESRALGFEKLGRFKAGIANIDGGKPWTRRPLNHDKTWANEWAGNETPTRWRGGVYDFSFGVLSGALSGWVNGSMNAAVWGVTDADGQTVKLHGGDAVWEGGINAAASVTTAATTGLVKNVFVMSAGGRLFHRQGFADFWIQLPFKIFEKTIQSLYLTSTYRASINPTYYQAP